MSFECLRATFLLPLLVTLAPLLVAAWGLWAYARRPAWAGLPPAAGGPAGGAARAADVAPYALLFGAVLGLCLWKVAPAWRMQNDEERDQLIAALCGLGRACPLVGNEMNRLRVQLGPLNRYFMAAGFLASRDPRVMLGAILALHALAAAWAARIGDALFGAPAGLAAGVALGTHPVLLDTYAQPSNGSWVTLFLVATVGCTLRWLRGEGGVPFVGAVTALACATQLHGTALEFAPIVLGLGLYYRPRTPRWALAAAAAVAALMYLPWLWFQLDSRGSGFRALSLAWILGGASGPANGPAPGLAARLVAPFRSLGPTAWLVAPGLLALLPGRDPARRGLLAFAAAPLAISLAGAAASGGLWADRYCEVFLPGVTLAAFAWVRLVRERAPRARWALAAAGALASVALGAAALARANPRGEALGRSRTQVSLAEDIEAVRALGARGFRTQDLETRVHGKAWARWTSARVYLGTWLLGPTSAPAPAGHALLGECAAPASFALWQQPLARGPGVRHHLIGYRPSLGPARVEVDLGDGPPWALDDALPFLIERINAGDGRMRRMVDPALAFPPAFDALTSRWLRPRRAPALFRVSAAVAHCAPDRWVTLLAPQDLPPAVSVNGAARAPDAALEEAGEVRYRLRLTAAECARAPVEVRAEFALPPGAMLPRRVDLYEEPAADCAGVP